MNYYERHLGDYARDTAHLSMLEHGAYNLLLDRCYASEVGIPADQAHRIGRARSAEECAAVDAVLAEFFTLQDGFYVQKRVQAEIERAHHRIETARNNGRTGGRPKKNPAGFDLHNRNGTQQKPSGLQMGSVLETGMKALQAPDSKHQSPEEDSLRSSSGAREPKETQRVLDSRETVDPEAFDADWLLANWPPTANNADAGTAIHCAMGLVNLGHSTWAKLRANVLALKAYALAEGFSDPGKVPGMAKYFRHDHPERYWARNWPVKPGKAQQRQNSTVAAGQAFLAGVQR